MRLPVVPLFILALPFIEIAGFVLVGRQIGVLATLGLVIASIFLGALLLRIQGLGVMARVRTEMAAGRDPSGELAKGLMKFFAAVLLLIPGFFTDIIALFLFLPPVQELAWKILRKRMNFSVVSPGSFHAGPGGQRPANDGQDRGRGKTIDLDSDDYSHEPRSDTPWRPIDKD